MKKFIYIFILLKVICNDDLIYWVCGNTKGCKEEDTILYSCVYEEYAFKLKPQICTKLGGQVSHFFCDNYISPYENFTIQKCSPSERRGCSFLKCFGGKGILRSIYECSLDGTTNHLKHTYFSHYLLSNYKELKKYIDFGIPKDLANFDNGELVCAFKTYQDLVDYLVWTVKNKFVYSWGGGHKKDFYGPTKGTDYNTECKNDVNVVGFDCSGLVLYMLKMLGNNIKMNGVNCESMYQLGKKLGLTKSSNEIKAGDVLLFGSEDHKSHTAIAISNSMALEAYKHYDDCTGIPIQTRKISDITNSYKNKKVWVVDFLQKKAPLDASKYLENEYAERKLFIVKAVYNFFGSGNIYYISVSGIGGGSGKYCSYVMFLNLSSKKKLRLLNENPKLKFYCDYNNSSLDENSTELSITNFNCSTDEYNETLNIFEDDNILDSLELVDKDEEKFYDLSNIKALDLIDITNNETFFDEGNLTNYITFTVNESIKINLNNDSSFSIEGKTDLELNENANFNLSLNNKNNSIINCTFYSKNINSSFLNCEYFLNESNFETEENINIYYIKEKEAALEEKNIFFIGLNKVEFIYKKDIISIDNNESDGNEKEKNKKNIIKIIIICVALGFGIGIIIFISIFIYLKFKKKNKSKLNSEDMNIRVYN